MIVRAAAADALVLVPRGEGELEAGSPVRFLPLWQLLGLGRVRRRLLRAARSDAHRLRVDDVALGREEAGMAGLEREQLEAARVQLRHLVAGTMRWPVTRYSNVPYGSSTKTASPFSIRSMRENGAP